MKMTNEQFTDFIAKADKLTEQHNGMRLGEVYMHVLKEHYPKIFEEIHDTELNVYIYRENIPLLFKYLLP